ncbi:hypothetical protein BgiMline_007035, partial [Biomphalaria glabrata]
QQCVGDNGVAFFKRRRHQGMNAGGRHLRYDGNRSHCLVTPGDGALQCRDGCHDVVSLYAMMFG